MFIRLDSTEGLGAGGKAKVREKYIKDSSSFFNENGHQKYNPDLPLVFFKSMELEEESDVPWRGTRTGV